MSRIDNWVGTRTDKTAFVPTQYGLLLEAVKEAIVNSICHRDYTSKTNVQVMLFKDKLEIWNPGHLQQGLTIKKLYSAHKSQPNNPFEVLNGEMSRKEMIEALGLKGD